MRARMYKDLSLDPSNNILCCKIVKLNLSPVQIPLDGFRYPYGQNQMMI